MTSAIAPDFPPSAADLPAIIARLGGIPPERVRLRPAPGSATESHLIRAIATRKGRLCELIDGTLVDKPMSVEEDVVSDNIRDALKAFVKPKRLGVVFGAQAMLRLTRGVVRLPDTSFVFAVKWRLWCRTRPAVADFGPDLAVEVLSRSNTREEMRRKRREYFAAGTQLVWEVNPRRKTVHVYTTPTKNHKLTANDVLTGDPVLPGFSIRVAELFADPLA